METKSQTVRGWNPTGMNLAIGLTIVLVASLLVIDRWQGRILVTSFVLPLLASALVVTGIGYPAIAKLKSLKMGQFIREDGPQAHLKKAGTPTMGGIFIVPVGLVLGLVWSRFHPDAIACALMSLGYLGIGGYDDWKSLSNRKNEGLTPKGKLGLQVLFAAAFCVWAWFSKGSALTTVSLPFGINIPLGFLFWGLAVFVLLAESNATNLTDGVDGLAGGTGAVALAGMGAIVAPKNPEIAVFAISLAGAYLGFLSHNRNKAAVFMGDTGSLALGGALAAIGILTNNLWSLFIISGIFFVESLSVISQVLYYKATKDENGKGKRLFRMAPYHHHLELGGWTETQVVGTFYAINALLAAIGIYLSTK